MLASQCDICPMDPSCIEPRVYPWRASPKCGLWRACAVPHRLTRVACGAPVPSGMVSVKFVHICFVAPTVVRVLCCRFATNLWHVLLLLG